MPFLETAGARLYYETDGDPGAPALLLIHAGVAQLRMWDEQLEAFAREHFVVRYDTRGFGRTQTQNVAYAEWQDAASVLDAAGVAAATVIGASQGGRFALDLATAAPERVRGVVTIGAGVSGHPEARMTEEEGLEFAELERLWDEQSWQLLNRRLVEVWNLRSDGAPVDAAFAARAYELNAPNLAHRTDAPHALSPEPAAFEQLGGLTVPALITRGAWDLSVEAVHQATLLERIPRAEGHVFAASAHLPSVQQPAAFTAVVTQWLARHGL